MDSAQIMILTVLVGTVALFLWGRWRHDMVAMASLLVCVVLGLVPTDAAFIGFGHPAVITVACILILSSALQRSGAVDTLSRTVLPQSAGPFVTMAALSLLAAILSAFMNNVGALALLMPIALQIANKQGLPPGKVLMPFGVMGGAYQANGHARFLSNIVDFGMEPQAAMDAPRAFALSDRLNVERGYAPKVHQALADMGHNVMIPDEAIGGSQAIRIHDNGWLEAGSDPRKDGCAIGY